MSSSPTSSADTPDFGQLAADYDELRPPDGPWWEVFEALVREGDLRGRRVLEVGCGTGVMTAALAERQAARVWGLDSSPEMLEVARNRVPRGVGLKLGSAEAIPFRDGWFERAAMRMTAHLLDRARAFAELRRVLAPGGKLAMATPDPACFDGLWMHPYFPSLTEIDRGRFPSEETLRGELDAAGFASVRIARLDQELSITRELALAKIRGRAFSTFQLIDPGDYEAGLARAEREFPEHVEYRHDWLIAVAEHSESRPFSS